MPYVVDVNRPLNLEFRQAVAEQLELARLHLERDPLADSESAIHEFRKMTKRLRAFLRLLGGTGRSHSLRLARRRLAKMARRLAGPRELVVAHQTLATIYKLLGRPVDTPALPQLATPELAARLVRAREDLSRHSTVILDLFEDELSSELVLGGLMASYVKGQRCLVQTLRSPEPEKFHQLRKRVKDRLYQQRLLAALSPRNLARENTQLALLADLLGEHHDLVRLRVLMRNEPKVFGRVPWASRVESGIKLGLRTREAKLRPLCEELYREPAEGRARRLSECLRNRRRAAPQKTKERVEVG